MAAVSCRLHDQRSGFLLPEDNQLKSEFSVTDKGGNLKSYDVNQLGCHQLVTKDVFEKFQNGKLLGKMLAYCGDGYIYDEQRLEIELDELKHIGSIRSSSSTLLLPKNGCFLYRHIGLLLDSSRCDVKFALPYDAVTARVTDEGKEVKWSMGLHRYITKDGDKKTPVNYNGAYKINNIGWSRDLCELIGEATERVNKMNEVVIDWDKSAVIAVLVCGKIQSYSVVKEVADDQLAFFGYKFKQSVKSLSSSLPIYSYNVSKGSLSLVSE